MTSPDTIKTVRSFRLNALVGGVGFAALLLFSLLVVIFSPFDPVETDFLNRFSGPTLEHWFGTDEYGRDIMTRIAHGSFVSLKISALSIVLAMLLGALIGLPAGYFGGWLDKSLMVVVEAVMAFPGLLLVLGIMAALGPNQAGVIIALGISYSPPIARVLRGTVFSLREKEFVESSRLIGNSEFTTMLRHILPNCISPLTVIGTSIFTAALLSETALSFLGLGVPPPAPSWGGMLADSRIFLSLNVWMGILPGLAISFALLSINLIGDALRDRFDPQMRSV